MLPIVLLVALGSGLVSAFVVWSIARGRARALAEDVSHHIEPYLRRKASEAGIAVEHHAWTHRDAPEQIVTHACQVATRLLDKDRAGGLDEALRDRTPEHRQLALADTQQVTAERLKKP